MASKTSSVDARSSTRQQADAAAETAQWEGFETEELLTEDGALEIFEHCRNLAKETDMDQTIALGSVRSQPFRWKEKVYRILRCEYANGQALIEVSPPDPDFAAEVKRRVEQDRFHALTYYQGFGFICFPEDYSKFSP